MKKFNIVIIGLGPRGLTVLERCLQIAEYIFYRNLRLAIHIVEPGVLGAGTHAIDQPDYLLLNTICGLPSMFPADIFGEESLSRKGPSFYEWLQNKEYTLASDGFTVLKKSGRKIEPCEYVPRRLLGEYLIDTYKYLVSVMPENVEIFSYPVRASKITSENNDETVFLENGEAIRCDYVFLTTGHTTNIAPKFDQDGFESRLIRNPYPLPSSTEQILPNQTVGISGFGLTAMDVVSTLTVGRGGRHVEAEHGQVYEPSGREPKIVLFSRSGFPYRSRPSDEGYFEYSPLIFTESVVEELRAKYGKLDFEEHLLPLLKREISIAYYLKCTELSDGWNKACQVRHVLESQNAEFLNEWLNSTTDRFGPFDADGILCQIAPLDFQTGVEYESWILSEIADDLREARHGLKRSAIKFAVELLLCLRDVIRLGVNFHGLTPSSHEWFIGTFVPTINRNVIGPQLERNQELISLVEAGVVEIRLGPSPHVEWNPRSRHWEASSTRLAHQTTYAFDWLLFARSEQPSVDSSTSSLIQTLHESGRIRPCRTGSSYIHGLDIDCNFHPIDSMGVPNMKLIALGPLCEGSTYYNHYVPTSTGVSTPFMEAHRTVISMFYEMSETLRVASAA